MTTIQDALKVRIINLCKERDINILKLSELSNVNQSTLNEFMQGRTKYPSINTIVKVANGLDMTLSEFFDDEVFEKIDLKN
ncbi:helix-turn-helix domain-containing protein [Oceanobacillus luteolus]|uniref:Helix-turn-helix domain-containing protein n=1 Tax=Oceanobacillus luteolus TaxID=1274358 RepID=A0ABW4HU22_9BACI